MAQGLQDDDEEEFEVWLNDMVSVTNVSKDFFFMALHNVDAENRAKILANFRTMPLNVFANRQTTRVS